jgi:tryptophan-rich sensory protein
MRKSYKIGVSISYAWMLLLNGLANALPINGITTGQISDNYRNLFAPTGLTFAIWAIIYSLLGVYVIAIWIEQNNTQNEVIGLYFLISAIFNGFWILAWHYDYLLVSVVLMFGILFSLIKIALEIKQTDTNLRIYFHTYFAWITIATIANITTYLVSIDFNLWLSESLWTVVILWIGTMICLLTAYRFKSVTYLLVAIWGFAGILIQHNNFFDGMYPEIIISLWGILAVFGSLVVYLLLPKVRKSILTS